MNADARVASMTTTRQFFENTTACFTEAQASFTPVEGMFTAAQQIAHAAEAVEWFVDGAFSPDGFARMAPDDAERAVRQIETLAQARAWWDRAWAHALSAASERSDEAWQEPIADPEIMTGAPRAAILGGLADHCGHHRGALAVYARLCGLSPAMPYGG